MNSLAPVIMVMSALACVLLALALWLFARARTKETQESIQHNVQRSLDIQRELQAASSPLPMPGAMPQGANAQGNTTQPSITALQWLNDHLGFGAWGIAPRTLAIIAAAGLLVILLAVVTSGAVAGAMALLLMLLLGTFAIWLRVSRRRAKMLLQLPGFLDNMVRLISIGNSPHAAFQFASGNVPEPLGGALANVSASLSVSPDLGQAMTQLERTWGLPEFGLLAAVFRMSTRYGGRADQVLERVSTYIRDRQSAERELHALSAEVRLSAWILALLPIVVGAFIMFMNKGYFMRMWNDSAGQKMILMAAGLEVLGSFILYRLARLK